MVSTFSPQQRQLVCFQKSNNQCVVCTLGEQQVPLLLTHCPWLPTPSPFIPINQNCLLKSPSYISGPIPATGNNQALTNKFRCLLPFFWFTTSACAQIHTFSFLPTKKSLAKILSFNIWWLTTVLDINIVYSKTQHLHCHPLLGSKHSL